MLISEQLSLLSLFQIYNTTLQVYCQLYSGACYKPDIGKVETELRHMKTRTGEKQRFLWQHSHPLPLCHL